MSHGVFAGLSAAGDAFGRRDLVDAVLKPSATIARATALPWWKRNQAPYFKGS